MFYNKLFKRKYSDLWNNKYCLVIISLAIILNIAIWVFFYYRIQPSNYPIPLHYNIYTGIDAIDYWYKIFIIPSFGLFSIIINILIGLYFFEENRYITYIMITSTFLIQIILFIAGIVLTIEL
jgi:hypothetical protein